MVRRAGAVLPKDDACVLLGSFEGREFLRQLDLIGSNSFPLVALAGAATGAVLSMQTHASLARFGAKSMLPAVIIYSLMKDGTDHHRPGDQRTRGRRHRSGAGIDEGHRTNRRHGSVGRRSFQVSGGDARFGVHCRAAFTHAGRGFLRHRHRLGGDHTRRSVSLRLFVNNGLSGVSFDDFLPPTLKTAVYGLIIGVVSSFQGLRTRGGTEGMGKSATSSVVLSSLFIILADVILVRLIIVFFN